MVRISVDKGTALIAVCRLLGLNYVDGTKCGDNEKVILTPFVEITFDFEKGVE